MKVHGGNLPVFDDEQLFGIQLSRFTRPIIRVAIANGEQEQAFFIEITLTKIGTIAVNPAESPPMALQRYFLVDLEFDRLPSPRVQERILIKFEHPPEALVYRCYRLVRRTFLEYFDV